MTSNPSKNRIFSAGILYGSLVVLVLLFYFLVLKPQQQYYFAHHVKIQGVYLLKPVEVNDFVLLKTDGTQFTKQNLRGRWSLIYFGFTSCEMICPRVMSVLNQSYLKLQQTTPKKFLPQIIFVTVDPERDSIHKLRDFVMSFNGDFLGLRGPVATTNEVKKQFHVIAEQTPKNNKGGYSIDHSPNILLVNPDAKIQAYFTYPQNANAMAEDYQKIIKK